MKLDCTILRRLQGVEQAVAMEVLLLEEKVRGEGVEEVIALAIKNWRSEQRALLYWRKEFWRG